MQIKTDDIIAYARECLGTPYLHQGRLLGIGLDCAGVIAHVAKRLGYEPVETPGYSRTPSNGLLELAADTQEWLYRVHEMQAGDILMMRFTGDPQHVGIYTGENLIHSYEGIGRVVEHRLDTKWKSRIMRIYRFKDAPVVSEDKP
jgi:NlpC/P60 family putative phage cell wall peptidase